MEIEIEECKKLLSRKELPEKETRRKSGKLKDRSLAAWLVNQSEKSDGFEATRQNIGFKPLV